MGKAPLPALVVCGSIGRLPMQLNTDQRSAVEHDEGPLLILAGAGSGKTRVLVERIARLIGSGLARPEEILAVTFTNKAARELTDRCRGRVGDRAGQIWAGTFHGFGARLLRRHAERLDYPAGFTIFDADDQRRLLKQIAAERNLDEALFPPEAFRAYIDTAKNDARLPEACRVPPGDEFGKQAKAVYTSYQQRLRRLEAMDFGDLILQVLNLWQRNPEILESYQRRFRFVHVDEYQDTNHAQYLLVSRLAALSSNICVVGDDDQSIYAWRGADLRNILEFERDFPGSRIVRLGQNYRSTATVIEAAQAVISHNPERMDKRLWTANDHGDAILVYHARDERSEAEFVTDRLLSLGRERSSAAVFYRTNAQSRAIEESLLRKGVPYAIVGGTRFYERREIKDLIAYLRFVSNPNDDVSLTRIVNIPPRGIGAVSWSRLIESARRRGESVWRTLAQASDDAGLAPASHKRIQAFRELALGWIETPSDSVTDLLSRIVEESGYAEYLRRSRDQDREARLENVRELLTVSQEFDALYDARELDAEDANLRPLPAFLERLALASEVDELDDSRAVATLMTLHTSKGLEFDHVIIVGVEEGLFPHVRSADTGERGVCEERRLCYVGITRARKTLALTHAVTRHLYGSVQSNLPSRFLAEIPPKLINYEGDPEPAYRDTRSFRRAEQDPSRKGTESDRLSKPKPPKPTRAADGRSYRVGMKVVHPMFGEGTIRKCEPSGGDAKLVVQFRRAGAKKLIARYARLQIL